eukprot:5603327-Prymnesium_polylepis.1
MLSSRRSPRHASPSPKSRASRRASCICGIHTFLEKRRTNGAALALGQPPRAQCPHIPRARTRRPCGQRA